jgi:hypothetical protein
MQTAALEGAGGASRTPVSLASIVATPTTAPQDQQPAAALEGPGDASRTLASFGSVVFHPPPTPHRASCQPQPGRARAAPAAHSCRLATSLAAATSRGARTCCQPQPGRARAAPAAHSSHSNASSPFAHKRDLRRSSPHETTVCERRPCRPGGGGRQRCAQTMRVCGWRRPRPPGLRLAIGPRCGGGGRQRCAQTMRVCGWRRPRPPGLRLAAGAPALSSAAVCSLHHKLHAPSPVASHDAPVREGPGAATGSALPSFVIHCAALGPDAASCSHGVVLGARVCSDGRARSWTNVCTRGPHGACGRANRLAWAQSPDERLPREKGRLAPFLLAGVQGQSPAGGAGGKAPAGAQGQRPTRQPTRINLSGGVT